VNEKGEASKGMNTWRGGQQQREILTHRKEEKASRGRRKKWSKGKRGEESSRKRRKANECSNKI
jgi:hypothetical protein